MLSQDTAPCQFAELSDVLQTGSQGDSVTPTQKTDNTPCLSGHSCTADGMLGARHPPDAEVMGNR